VSCPQGTQSFRDPSDFNIFLIMSHIIWLIRFSLENWTKIEKCDSWFCRFCILSKRRPNGLIRHLAEAVRLYYPYDIKKLEWDENYKTNSQERYCYCGGPGDWNMKMLQCNQCNQWFHEACIAEIKKPILNGDLFYLFNCSVCNKGKESIQRLYMSWSEALHLIIYNLSLISPARFHRYGTVLYRIR